MAQAFVFEFFVYSV